MQNATIKKVIEIALLLFIPGERNNQLYKKDMDRSAPDFFWGWSRYDRFIYKQDKRFSSLFVSKIRGSHLLAGFGPNKNQIPGFLNDLQRNNIKQVIALGSVLALEAKEGTDFYDYSELGNLSDADYKIKVNSKRGRLLHEDKYGYVREIVELEVDFCSQKGEAESNFEVTIIPWADGQPLCMETWSDQEKEIVWQLFQKSLYSETFVHCHAGIGRTGSFILILMILADYKNIFS